MKDILFLFLLVVSKSLFAQEPRQPIVDYEENNLILDNFPAISEDGSHYLAVYNQYSCCIYLGNSLQKIETSSGKILSEIIISPTEESVQFTISKQKSIYKNIKHLLKSNHYYTMKLIDKFKVMYGEDKDELYIMVNISDNIYASKKFILPRINSHGFCCNGGIDMNENCLLNQEIINVSFSIRHNVLLVETGLDQLADGCDQGPFYQVIPISKN
ncbi:hypothetical protein [Aquimarina latercula]|uniref:hypothetical protein n=1 Tax=Aquimarina latercula TaxID=987 RepID=UPI00042113F6|nr:hypothetical protein [Aquimarina latercula]